MLMTREKVNELYCKTMKQFEQDRKNIIKHLEQNANSDSLGINDVTNYARRLKELDTQRKIAYGIRRILSEIMVDNKLSELDIDEDIFKDYIYL